MMPVPQGEATQYGVWPVSSMENDVPGTVAASASPSESVSHKLMWRSPGSV